MAISTECIHLPKATMANSPAATLDQAVPELEEANGQFAVDCFSPSATRVQLQGSAVSALPGGAGQQVT